MVHALFAVGCVRREMMPKAFKRIVLPEHSHSTYSSATYNRTTQHNTHIRLKNQKSNKAQKKRFSYKLEYIFQCGEIFCYIPTIFLCVAWTFICITVSVTDVVVFIKFLVVFVFLLLYLFHFCFMLDFASSLYYKLCTIGHFAVSFSSLTDTLHWCHL